MEIYLLNSQVDSQNPKLHSISSPGNSLYQWTSLGSRIKEGDRILSHLKALRSIVDRGRGGIILEEPVDVHYFLQTLTEEKLAPYSFLSFSGWEKEIFEKEFSSLNFPSIEIYSSPSIADFTRGYWISREKAQEILLIFDRPFYSLPGNLSLSSLFPSSINFTRPRLVYPQSREGLERSLQRPSLQREMDLIYYLPSLEEKIYLWSGYSQEGRNNCEQPSFSQEGSQREFLQTLLVFRQVATDGGDSAIILSPEMKLYSSFSDRFDALVEEMEDFLLLSPYVTNWEGLEIIAETLEKDRIYTVSENVYSAGAYWISREWIERLLHLYDRPRRYLPPMSNFNLLTLLSLQGAKVRMVEKPLAYREDTPEYQEYFSAFTSR